MTPIAPHITAFLRDHLPRVRSASEHTCDAYSYAFQMLFEYASGVLRCRPSQLQLEQLDAPLVLAFLAQLESRRRCSPSTRNARLAAIKSFFRFVEHRVPSALDQVRRVRAIPRKRSTSRLVRYLSRTEIEALLDAPGHHARMELRDRAMLHLAYAAGLRVSELVGLRLADLQLQPTPSIIVHGKGRRERALPLWRETAQAIRAWLAVRGDAPTIELFVSARGGPLTRSGFEYLLAKHVSRAATKCPTFSTKRVTPHVLRHTCAMHTLQATRDVRKVALWLGHSSITTTEVYLRADPSEKLEAIGTLIPPSLRPGRFKPPDKLIASLRDLRSEAPANESPHGSLNGPKRGSPRAKRAQRSA